MSREAVTAGGTKISSRVYSIEAELVVAMLGLLLIVMDTLNLDFIKDRLQRYHGICD